MTLFYRAIGCFLALWLFSTADSRANGIVSVWGNNQYGQTTLPGGIGTSAAVAAGLAHSISLRPNGTVVAWGYNDYGQATVPSGLTGVIAVAAGAAHSLALKADGTVV